MSKLLPSRSPQQPPRAFTLTELLIVIAIVAILAALLLSVLGKVQASSRKVQVVADFKSIKTAIISYYQDYRKYPINDIQDYASQHDAGNDTCYGDPGGLYPGRDLFNILRAQDDDFFNQNDHLNPNGTVYWPGPFVKNPSKPVSGITTVDYTANGKVIPKGSFVDPWGHEYVVWFDINHDNDLSAAANWFYHDIDPFGKKIHESDPPLGFEIGSLGPDGKFGTNGNKILKGSDDLVTWQ